MKIIFDNLKYYYLTVPKTNDNRKIHLLEEFKEFNLKEVNPVPASYFKNNKIKSGATGFLKILELASLEMGNDFQPFVIFEDDVKKNRKFPDFIEIPDNCDLFYLGLSEWGITNNINRGFRNSVCYSDVDNNDDIIRIFNMLSTHGMIICSIKGMLTLQKCLLEDFYKCNLGYDITVCCIQPYLNVYALKEPLVYQYSKLGGHESSTKINFKKFQKKSLPDDWKNKTNLSVITLNKI
tara:strand:+ start:310 stop:1020 length:711 start_codon:yes stop_codon:yes gene_type:complete